MNHAAISRKGGRVRSAAKTRANRQKAAAYWQAVREGICPAPRRPKAPPPPAVIAARLADYCQANAITRLEIFGSVARGESRRGSDIDLLATFAINPGSRFFAMESEMTTLLGIPVHLLTRDSVEQLTNPYRRESILAEAREIYRA